MQSGSFRRFLMCFLIATAGLVAAEETDLTSCISSTFKNYDLSALDQTSMTTVILSIQQSDFSTYQHNATINGNYKQVFHLDGTYSDFTQKREQYQQKNASESQSASSASHLMIGIPKEAYHTIEKCMALKAQIAMQRGQGFIPLVEVSDQTNVTLKITWHAPVEAPTPLRLTDSWIVNGTAQNAPQGKLFPAPLDLKNGVEYPISITRDDPNAVVKMGIITEGNVHNIVASAAMVEIPSATPSVGTAVNHTPRTIPIPATTCRTKGNFDNIFCDGAPGNPPAIMDTTLADWLKPRCGRGHRCLLYSTSADVRLNCRVW